MVTPLDAMKLSIVIVSWNTRELLARCLEHACEAARGLEHEIIVVDNASSDGSPEFVRQHFPEVRLIQATENLGFARGNNLGIAAAAGELLLLLNSDAFLTAGALHAMLDAFSQAPRLGFLGPQLVYGDGSPQPSHGPLPTLASEISSLLGLDRFIAKPASAPTGPGGWTPTGWVKGACLMARRSTLDEIGLFDERFFFFSEEVDLCARARQAGWRVGFLPGQQVVHLEGGSTGQTPERVLRLYHAKGLYFDKHSGARARLVFLAAARTVTWLKVTVYTLLRHLTRGRVQKDALWRLVARSL